MPIDPEFDYYEYELEGQALYELSLEERMEWLGEQAAKVARRLQDASEESKGVKTLVEDFEARKRAQRRAE